MKITVNQQQLNTALSFLQKAIPAKPQLPILSSVYINAQEEGISICATDLYFGVKTTVPYISQSELGEVVIPGKLLKETINSLAHGDITLEKKESKVFLKAKNVKTSMQCQESDDYPAFPTVTGERLILTYSHIVSIEKLLSFATSTDVARPVLTALLFRLSPQGLTVVSTDGFRLAVLTFTDITAEIEQEFLMPSNAFSEISRIMNANSAQSAEFTISQELKQVLCSFANVEIFIRLIEGAYPPYEKIIPALFTTEVTMSVEELTEQLKRAMIFARDASNIISLKFDPEQVSISATSPISGTYQGILEEIKMTGAGSEIAFNARYVLDFLQAVKTGTIWFGMSESLKPAMLKHTEVPEYQYVVMPFKVNA